MTIINVCNLFAPIVGPLIRIINILILILFHFNKFGMCIGRIYIPLWCIITRTCIFSVTSTKNI